MLTKIGLVTTLRCDLKCSHCLRDFPEERPDFPLELLPKLLSGSRKFGAGHIALTGGEPHLHPRFTELVEMIVDQGFSWHFVSNGQQVDPYIAVLDLYGKSISHISLSIDAATPEIHDNLRNRNGAFDHVINAVKIYQDAGYQVRVTSSINQSNKHELKEIIYLVKELGAVSLSIGGTIPTEWNQHLVLSEEESLKLAAIVETSRRELDFKVRTNSSLTTQGGVVFCKVLNMNELTFNARGELVFCCDTSGHGAAMGSLFTDSFSALIENWINKSEEIKIHRTRCISTGIIPYGFNSCNYCNDYFSALGKI